MIKRKDIAELLEIQEELDELMGQLLAAETEEEFVLYREMIAISISTARIILDK